MLLGDILDLLRSSRWNGQTTIRPWSDWNTEEFFDQVNRITNDILQHNEEGLAVLRSLAAEGGVTVPPALRTGRPASDAARQPEWRSDCTIWWATTTGSIHLPGTRYDLIRQKLVRQMGLANRWDRPFPHDYRRATICWAICGGTRSRPATATSYDPFNFEGERDASSLGDVIVIELVNRFALEVETQLANDLPASTVLGLREIDNVRPSVLIPVWIDGLLERTCPTASMRKQMKRVWDRLVDEFLAIEFVRQRDTWSPIDLVDGLRSALKFSKRLSVGWASSVASGSTASAGPSDPPTPARDGRAGFSQSPRQAHRLRPHARQPRPCRWTPATPKATCSIRCTSMRAPGGASTTRPSSPPPNTSSSRPT